MRNRKRNGGGPGSSSSDSANLAREHSPDDIAFMAIGEDQKLTRKSWLLDSAASVHITNDKSLFHAYTPLTSHNVVGIERTPALGQGSIQLQFKLGTRLTTVTLARGRPTLPASGPGLSGRLRFRACWGVFERENRHQRIEPVYGRRRLPVPVRRMEPTEVLTARDGMPSMAPVIPVKTVTVAIPSSAN
ncbi:hypothetical protein C8R46DRAFT_1222865 [Mycena filopes]|nr:hypothetical protein C8R46DRAFT_1222865 [Mycena filopes]